MYMKFNLK